MLNGMPNGNPPGFGPKSGCRLVLAESMLRSQAALCESTGSREMSVFHTLLAGNIGQPGAPGTVVPPVAGAAVRGGSRDDLSRPAPAAATWFSPASRTTPGAAPLPAAGTAAVPHAARNTSGAAIARTRAGVVRSGPATGLILPRPARRRAACAGSRRPGARPPS